MARDRDDHDNHCPRRITRTGRSVRVDDHQVGPEPRLRVRRISSSDTENARRCPACRRHRVDERDSGLG
ncbi:MAG: hypothetical protein WKF83_05700 [Nocardioidaceae bacterium]